MLNVPEFNKYKNDPVIKLAMESSIVNIFWKFVPVEGFVNSTKGLMDLWGNFQVERSHWWRARKAQESDDHIRSKWDNLLGDLPNLLNFHNCLKHVKYLVDKPTLKHTVQLCGFTSEGKTYENGQGRSIPSECRHIMVRRECNIPINPAPAP